MKGPPRPAPPGDVEAPPHASTVLVLLCLAQFMVILDITVVNVALPDIGSSLDLDRETLTWVVTAYTMALGGLLIFAGRLADTYGPRRVFLTGLALFTTTSLTSGLATEGWILLSSRLGQGAGAALLSPAALSLLMRMFSGPTRDRALAAWAAIGGAGAAAGVLVGGMLTSGPGWEWAFFINVPVGLVVAISAIFLVPTGEGRARRNLDLKGAVTGVGAVGLLVLGLTRAGETGWMSGEAVLPAAGSALLFASFLFVETRAADPLITRHLFRGTSLAGGLAVMGTASAAMVATFFLNSLYLQRVRGFGALETGLVFLPAAVAVVAGAHLARHALGRVGPRPTGGAGLTLTALGLVAMGIASGRAGSVYATLVPGLVLTSIGVGLAFMTATAGSLAKTNPNHVGVTSGLLSTSHELGAALGVAAVSTLAASSLVEHTADVSGFQHAYLIAAAVAGMTVAAALGLLPRERPRPDQLATFAH